MENENSVWVCNKKSKQFVYNKQEHIVVLTTDKKKTIIVFIKHESNIDNKQVNYLFTQTRK